MDAAAVTLDAPEPFSVPSESVNYAPGHWIDQRYQLQEKLGDGGMGSVWRAADATLAREVAIKLIHDHHRAPDSAARLHVEAQSTAQLDHPAIVRVYDVGQTDLGDPFLVMELLRGESLAAIVDLRGKLPELSAVQMMLPIAGALVVAHAAGVVHRDIKPDNVMVVQIDGDPFARQPKLVDFGIARREHCAVDRRLTIHGALLGSPGYMAPEQALGRMDVDARVDVWAFSVVLYEVMTGEMPFVRPTVPASLSAILRHDPTPTSEMGGDPELWEIVKRGMAKDRDARWPSMLEMRAALVDWARARGATIDVTGTPLSRPPPRPSGRPSRPSDGPSRPGDGAVPRPSQHPVPSFDLAYQPPPPVETGTLYTPPPPPAEDDEEEPPTLRSHQLAPAARLAAVVVGASIVISGVVSLLAR